MDINFIQEVSEDLTHHSMVSEDPLAFFVAHFGMYFDVEESIREVNALLDSVPSYPPGQWRQKPEPLNPSNPPPLPSSESPPQLDIKPLPENMKYAFIGPSKTLPVIIASDLSSPQEDALLNVLKEHREALRWTMADIKGISPSICQHLIHLEENFNPCRDPQRRLNPHMAEVVRGDVIKWLDVGISYPISDSKWVSLVQVVPKKSGITMVRNEENELVPTRV